MSKFEYNRRRLTSITEIQGAALVLNTPAHQALSVDDMRRMFPEASISEAPRNGTLTKFSAMAPLNQWCPSW